MTSTLYRPVNKTELDLIADLEWKGFPPRLPEQPIFYPVMNQEYASQITVEWNLPSFKNGFVTKFEVESEYLTKFKVEKVGLDHFLELWVPSEDMNEFNSHIVGHIEVVEAYSSEENSQFVMIEEISEQKDSDTRVFVRSYPPSKGVELSTVPMLGNVLLKNKLELVRRLQEHGKTELNSALLIVKEGQISDLKKGHVYLLT